MYSSTNYFQDWIKETFNPCSIVYSTKNAKEIFSKNNLSPAEFLRPFGDFKQFDIPFSDNDINTITNFKIDFYDSEKFIEMKEELIPEYLKNLMTNEKIRPNWSLDTKILSKNINISDYQLRKDYYLPWFKNFEKLIFECLQFNSYDKTQQPLIIIYICSLNEDPNIINQFYEKKNLPFNLKYDYYTESEIKLLIVLNDNSDPDKFIQENFKEKTEEFRTKFKYTHYILFWNINLKKNLDEKTEDIWSDYFHLIEIFAPDNDLKRKKDIYYGQYITQSEINTYKKDFFESFFMGYAISKIMNKNNILKQKVSEKNKFTLNFFKKEDSITSQGNLSENYSTIYDYAILNFLFRNYKTAESNLKYLYTELKKTEYYLPIYQIYMICKFINSALKKDNYQNVYKKYNQRKLFNNSVKWGLIQLKMYEDQKKFEEIIYFYDSFRHSLQSEKIIEIITKNDRNKINILESYHYFKPLLLEKIGIYHKYQGNYRKFLLFNYKSGEAYSFLGKEMEYYSLNCYGNLLNLIDNPSNSFVEIRNEVNYKMGLISKNFNMNEEILKFYKNCIEFSCYSEIPIETILLYFQSFFDCIIKNNYTFKDIKSLNIPQVDNSSIFITEQQDYDISLISNEKGYEKIHWNVFNKYAEILSTKPYCNIDEKDLLILRNLDNVIMDKAKYSNFFNRRIFQGNINEKIYLKIKITNPLEIDIEIKATLLCEYLNEIKNEKEDIEKNIELNDIKMKLLKKSSSDIELYIKPLSPGKIFINGLKLYIHEQCEIIHLFNEKNKNKLYSYRKKNKSQSKEKENNRLSNASSHSNPDRESLTNYKIKKAKIIYEIKSPEEDIIILFPMNKEISIKQYQLILFPIIIRNNSKYYNIKRFTIFLEDSLNRNNNNRIPTTLFDYIHRNISLKGENRENTVYIPLIPQVNGIIYIKVLIKFEDELKSKPIEIKRYIIKLNVSSSLTLFAEEKITNFDNKNNEFQKIYLSTLLSASIEDDSEISDLEMKNILFGKVFCLKEKSNQMIWKKMTDNKKEKNYCKIDLIYHFKGGEDIENFMFLEILNEYDYIKKKLTSILNRSNYFLINWNAKDKNNNLISGIYFYSVKLGTPKYTYQFILNLIHISTQLNIKKTKINDIETLVNVNVILNKKGINQIKEIEKYEIFVVNEIESNINWIGLKLYTIDNNLDNCNYEECEKMTFNFITSEKGMIEVNQIKVKLYMSKLHSPTTTVNNEQDNNYYLINHITKPISILID